MVETKNFANNAIPENGGVKIQGTITISILFLLSYPKTRPSVDDLKAANFSRLPVRSVKVSLVQMQHGISTHKWVSESAVDRFTGAPATLINLRVAGRARQQEEQPVSPAASPGEGVGYIDLARGEDRPARGFRAVPRASTPPATTLTYGVSLAPASRPRPPFSLPKLLLTASCVSFRPPSTPPLDPRHFLSPLHRLPPSSSTHALDLTPCSFSHFCASFFIYWYWRIRYSVLGCVHGVGI